MMCFQIPRRNIISSKNRRSQEEKPLVKTPITVQQGPRIVYKQDTTYAPKTSVSIPIRVSIHSNRSVSNDEAHQPTFNNSLSGHPLPLDEQVRDNNDQTLHSVKHPLGINSVHEFAARSTIETSAQNSLSYTQSQRSVPAFTPGTTKQPRASNIQKSEIRAIIEATHSIPFRQPAQKYKHHRNETPKRDSRRGLLEEVVEYGLGNGFNPNFITMPTLDSSLKPFKNKTQYHEMNCTGFRSRNISSVHEGVEYRISCYSTSHHQHADNVEGFRQDAGWHWDATGGNEQTRAGKGRNRHEDFNVRKRLSSSFGLKNLADSLLKRIGRFEVTRKTSDRELSRELGKENERYYLRSFRRGRGFRI